MSVPYICRHFKDQTGKTISTYIQEVKVEESKRLLLHSNKSIFDISTQLAFSSPKYFSMIFKKIVGLTPDEFRKNKPFKK